MVLVADAGDGLRQRLVAVGAHDPGQEDDGRRHRRRDALHAEGARRAGDALALAIDRVAYAADRDVPMATTLDSEWLTDAALVRVIISAQC